MRLNGKNFSNEDHVVGPYPVERTVKGEKVVFGVYAQPIWDYDEFDAAYPRPEPPKTAFSKRGKQEGDVKHPQYLADLKLYTEKREGYTLLKSLEPSKLELDGVALDKPDTWHKVTAALQKMFSYFEYNAIMSLIDEACGIDSLKVEANRQTFLSQQEAEPDPDTRTSS